MADTEPEKVWNPDWRNYRGSLPIVVVDDVVSIPDPPAALRHYAGMWHVSPHEPHVGIWTVR